MTRKAIKGMIVISTIFIGFALLLLLPREMKITQIGRMSFIAEYPFTMDLFKHNLQQFCNFVQEHKGLGNIRTGMKVSESTFILFNRSLAIILPSFFTSIFVGILLGSIQFRFRDKAIGRVFSFFNWASSSVPDFFVYIAFQYLLIKMMNAGFPNFNLYGNDQWYSFILPYLAITIFPTAHIAKLLYVCLLHESKQDYIRTSYAKGMGEMRVQLHMLRNCSAALLNQSQSIMLYILTSLPIIEKLSNYRGAGYHLLNSILHNEDNLALGLILPFLLLMFAVLVISQFIKLKLTPRSEMES